MTGITENRQSRSSNAGRLSSSFRLLVSPANTWVELSQAAKPVHALFAQFLLLAMGRLIAWQPMNDELQSIGGSTATTSLPGSMILEMLMLATFVVAANFAFAGILYCIFALLSMTQKFERLLIWISFGVIPICLGYFVGTIPLWIIQPLSTDPAAALAWQIKPFSLSITSFQPTVFTPLSAQWFIATTFDFFGCWALLLLAIGAVRYLKYKISQSLWITCGLVLLFFIAATGMWQVFQALLVYQG